MEFKLGKPASRDRLRHRSAFCSYAFSSHFLPYAFSQKQPSYHKLFLKNMRKARLKRYLCQIARQPSSRKGSQTLSNTACRMRDFSYMCRLSLHVGVTPVCNNQACERHVGCTRLIQCRMKMQASLGFYSKNWQGSQQLGQRHPAAEHGVGCAKCNPMKRCERIYCAKTSAICTKTKANAEALLR